MISATPTSPPDESRAARSLRIDGDLFHFAALVAAILSLYLAWQLSSGLMSFPSNRADAAVAEDLVAFHRAGEMAIAGEAATAYDPSQFRVELAEHQKGLLWLNPPHAFLIMAPIAALPYGVAKSAWVALGVLSMLSIMMIAKLRAPSLFVLALASPAMLISTLLLQLGPFIALGLAAALTMAPKRPLIAGLVLALLTMKPQYGLMAPVFLVATGQWRVIISAAISTIVLIVASASIFGVESWGAFLHSLSSVHAPFARQALEGTVAFSQTAAKLGGSDAARIASQAAGVMICGAVVWIAARRLARTDAIALTLLASLAAAPSAWIYDWPIVAAGVAFMAARPNWPIPVKIAAALAWTAPLAPVFAENGFSRLASPFALDALLAAASVWLLRAKD